MKYRVNLENYIVLRYCIFGKRWNSYKFYLGVAIVAGVNLLFIATEFIPYALKPEFRTVYRESRPQMAERFDSVLRIGQDSVVLNKDVVLEEARKARRQ